MPIYRYQNGDRPLDGFTIQHGLGRGGFGEVYYALSDSGREVALKAVQNYEEIELRGIRHCMNLKSAQLVSIFDIKHNSDGLPFVIMEYVDGPSLREIIDTHPEGLGPAKAAFFVKEIAKGLNYLHDCGVVHRDLKPHNVFYEQGVVKIGDYSLSKAISTSHRSGHTVTVGTVHYMAPEIGIGRYDHTVDIYALGVLLYEMLTGHPPCLGESMGEVLMKHVAGDINLEGIEEPFRRVIAKALAKEPNDRYQTAEAMVDDLMGHAELQNSVASLGPESLTIIADQAMQSATRKRQAQDHPNQSQPNRPQPHATIHTAQVATDRPELVPFRLNGWFFATFLAALMAIGLVGTRGPNKLFFLVVMGGMAYALFHLTKSLSPRLFGRDSKQRVKDFNATNVRHVSDLLTPRTPVPPHAATPPHVPKEPFAKKVVTNFATPPGAPVYPPQADHFPDEPAFGVGEPSAFSRLISLLVCAVPFTGIPLAGLQRLYVGRIKTGILWVLTFGLLGFGQIYDMVMISLGQFKDADGNRVLNFMKPTPEMSTQPVNDYSNVVRHGWTESRIGFKLGNLLFNFLGGILLLVSLALGAVLAVNLPYAMASGVFGQELAHEIASDTIADWHVVAEAALSIAVIVTGTLSVICLFFARRESTWRHLMRLPFAAFAFWMSVQCLGNATQFGHRWNVIAEHVGDNMIGEAIHITLDSNAIGSIILASISFVVGVFILAWPAKRRKVEVEKVVPVNEELRREHQRAV